MKILFFTQYFWPENFRINELALHFHKKRNDVKILSCNPGYPNKDIFKDYYNKKKKYNNFNGIEIFRVPVFSRRKEDFSIIINYITFIFSSFVFGFFKLLKLKTNCIFIFGTSPILSALPAIFLGKIFKKKIFLWVLDLWPDNLIELGKVKNKILIFILKKTVKYIYDNCDVVFVQSKSFKTEIAKISKCKCIYFPSWAEDIGKNRVLAKEIKKYKHHLKILFTGNIGEAQSFESVVKCANLLKKKYIAKWIIVGSGRWKNNLKKLINENDLNEDFELIDNVPLSRVKSFFNSCDILFLSLKKNKNYKKTIPGKLFTYLSSGKPILGMISGEANSLIKKSKAGLVCESDDFKTLRDNIIKFKNYHPSKRRQMGINGKKYSKKYFDKFSILSSLEKIIIKNLDQ